MERKAEIGGAGFAGLTAATALAQRGWSVQVHEAAPEPRSVGAGIYVFPFAQDVLREVGALDRLMEAAIRPMRHSIYFNGRLHKAASTGGRFLTVTRHHLHHSLLEGAKAQGVKIRFGSQAVSADRNGALRFSNGEEVWADLIVGADGIRSAVAASVGLVVERTQHEEGIVRILLDRRDFEAPEWNDIHEYFDDRFEPLRILYTPCGSNSFYICLTAPSSHDEALALPIDPGRWSRSFPQFASALRRVGTLGRFDRYSSSVLPRWHTGRFAVIGDAAHAMPSSLGQGAGVGMWNAHKFGMTLGSGDSVLDALSQWERQARPKVDGWQVQAQQVLKNRANSEQAPFSDL